MSIDEYLKMVSASFYAERGSVGRFAVPQNTHCEYCHCSTKTNDKGCCVACGAPRQIFPRYSTGDNWTVSATTDFRNYRDSSS